jgi:tetratricopeptide (TPR) repeat protein
MSYDLASKDILSIQISRTMQTPFTAVAIFLLSPRGPLCYEISGWTTCHQERILRIMRLSSFMLAALLACTVLFSALAGCGSDKSLKYYNLGVDAANRNDLDGAISLWTESLKYRPDNPKARYNLGVALFEEKKYAPAADQLREAARLDPRDFQALAYLGNSLEALDSLVEAKSSYSRAVNINPNYEPALAGLASIALKEGQYQTAEDYATTAAQIEPEDIQANLLLSEAYDRLGDHEAAYAQLGLARRLAPNNPEVFFLLGKVAYARHMYSDAVEALESARKLGMSTADLFLYLGLSAGAMDDLASAENYFKLAVFKNDTSAAAWKGLAETYVRTKKWSEASPAVSKALALNPDDMELYIDRARVELNAGDFAAAAADLEKVERSPDAPPITFYYLGHAYLRSGDRAKARAAFERFIEKGQASKSLIEEAKTILSTLSP